MKILAVITSIRKASGATSFCCGLTNQLARLGHQVTIAIMAEAMSEEWHVLESSINVITIDDLVRGTDTYDVAHVHGIWNPPIHHACVWLRSRGIPYVISPHGSLAPWAMGHHAWKKWIAWYLWFRRDMLQAAAIHVTAESEEGWLAKFGLGLDQPIVLAPLGTSLPETGGDNSTVDLDLEPRPKQQRTLLFVGRIYPVKALDRLIKAFQMVPHKDWRLRLVGPDQSGHMSELKKIAGGDVDFVGPKFDDELAAEYDACDALALVSHTENFGATVVDAMAHGKPVITSTKTPWGEVVDEHCGWWVDNDPAVLSKALGELLALTDEQRLAMGANGKALVARKYTWEAIANTMLESYRSAMR